MVTSHIKKPRNLCSVVILLFLNVFFLTLTLIIAIHGTWLYSQRLMRNSQNLSWSIGILYVSGSVVCDSVDDPVFFAICMSIFKNLQGSLWRIQNFVCDLDTISLKIEPSIIEQAHMFKKSCADFQFIFYYSVSAFLLLVLAQIFFSLSSVSLLTFCYHRFHRLWRSLFWCCCLFQTAGLFLYAASLCLYYIKVVPQFDRVMIYSDIANPQTSMLSLVNPSRTGGAFQCLAVIAMVHVFLLIAHYCCIPVVEVPDLSRTKQLQNSSDPVNRTSLETDPFLATNNITLSSCQSFWAYMPYLFRPEYYIAEIPEISY